ncbi:MAG: nickel-dependent hydrogenase large subunit [Trueperaceae bacterium]|nr:MAG: nickel-dependent hydrogenase large subunit [Trueperaceae bacterium]
MRISDAYEPPEQPFVKVEPQAGTGFGWSEAPRGMLYHRYTLDAEGTILDANIIPPTSQNQKSVESDLRAFVAKNVDLPAAELQWQCEQAIRNYDPCISCATHFLDLHIERD